MKRKLIFTSILLASITACAEEEASTQAVVEMAKSETIEQPAGHATMLAAPAVVSPAKTAVMTEKPMLVAAVDTPSSSESTATASTGVNHEIKAQVTKFIPMVTFIQPGDTVTFINMAGHDTASIEGMIPEGAEAWQSKMGETFTHTFSQEGAYIFKCNPHVSLGMIGAIVVGTRNPANLASIEADPQNKGMVGRAIRMLKKELAK